PRAEPGCAGFGRDGRHGGVPADVHAVGGGRRQRSASLRGQHPAGPCVAQWQRTSTPVTYCKTRSYVLLSQAERKEVAMQTELMTRFSPATSARGTAR